MSGPIFEKGSCIMSGGFGAEFKLFKWRKEREKGEKEGNIYNILKPSPRIFELLATPPPASERSEASDYL
jgi:hypothetical protein